MSFLLSRSEKFNKFRFYKVMEDTITPEDTLVDEPGTSSPDGEGADSPVVDKSLEGVEGEKSLVDKVYETTGKKFASEAEALKSIKDTFNYVGDIGGLVKGVMDNKGISRQDAVKFVQDKMTETPVTDLPASEVDISQFVPRSEFEEANYYNTEEGSVNKPHKGIIDAFKSKPEHVGKSIPDVIAADEELRNTLEKAKAHDEAEGSKSVLQSNPRLGVVQDKLTQSKESMAKFNETGDSAHHEQAKTAAVDSVLETMQTEVQQ